MSNNLDELITHIIDATFDYYDKNKNKYLEREEVKRLLKEAFTSEDIKMIGDSDLQLEESVEEFMKNLDKDNDGKLSKEELKEGLVPIIKAIVEEEKC